MLIESKMKSSGIFNPTRSRAFLASLFQRRGGEKLSLAAASQPRAISPLPTKLPSDTDMKSTTEVGLKNVNNLLMSLIGRTTKIWLQYFKNS
jgi:hypothetical protein